MEANILALLAQTPDKDKPDVRPTSGNILDLLQTGFKLESKPSKPRIFTERRFNVVAYGLVNGQVQVDPIPARVIENVGNVTANRWRKTLKKQFYRVDKIEIAGKAHGEELIFTEKEYIEKNVSKFTPGNPEITDKRLGNQRRRAHSKVLQNQTRKNNSTEIRSDANEVQIFSKISGNLVFKGTDEQAVAFMLGKQIKINEHVFYVNDKIYSTLKRMEEREY